MKKYIALLYAIGITAAIVFGLSDRRRHERGAQLKNWGNGKIVAILEASADGKHWVQIEVPIQTYISTNPATFITNIPAALLRYK